VSGTSACSPRLVQQARSGAVSVGIEAPVSGSPCTGSRKHSAGARVFARGTLRLSELEKAIPGVSRKMLVQQLRELEREGVASRTVYPQVPPKVEYGLTEWGKAMCPALDALLEWAAQRPKTAANGPFNS
jgi:DNA-binding HxlR family transcriptional regulator